MKLERITDYALAISVLTNKTIASEIYEDTAKLTVPDIISEYWVGAYTDSNNIIGCYRIHCMGAVTWQIHARILPKYRQKFALIASKEVLKWACINIKNFNCMMCFVPKVHKKVYLHAIQVGFKAVGVLPKSFLVNNALIDQYILAITKSQILGEDICQQPQ